MFLLCLLLASTFTCGQPSPASPNAALYRRLREAGLDAGKVYRVRDASFDREDLHFSLNEGWLIAGEEISGHVTAVFFVGDGEVLLIPPDHVERSSLALFTHSAVLEEKFTSAYFRFFDDHLLAELGPWLRASENAELVQRWSGSAKGLAQSDALRLLLSYVNRPMADQEGTRYLHARVSGVEHGVSDIFYDESAAEQITVGQASYAPGGEAFYNIWTSFESRSHRGGERAGAAEMSMKPAAFHLKANVRPPDSLDGEAELELQALRPGTRAVVFELSRYLKVSAVTIGEHPVEFLQNEALEGTRVAREGNDVVTVILPHVVDVGQKLKLRFVYSGSVLSDAGGGLLYVGARGNWYPNLGLNMASFDLEFRYPPEWTLVATGKRIAFETVNQQQLSRWISERPIPVAGFNLGHYQESLVLAGGVRVQSYAAGGVERGFPVTTKFIEPSIDRHGRPQREVVLVPAPTPKPAGQAVASEAAAAIEYLSARIGPFPYSTLELTQMPGRLSQGWPGLVFLSSLAFVPQSERSNTLDSQFNAVLFDRLMPAHETAHQWWGDSVYWKTYRDQWLSEALANYSAMLSFENERPQDFRTVLEYYRAQLARNGSENRPNREAGPVTLGQRLNSSIFPRGYELIAYGRGAWLFHMLRELLRDGMAVPGHSNPATADQVFFSVLRGLQQDFAGKQMSTRDVQQAFERVLPPSLYYEGKPSLDWFFEGWVRGSAMPRYELSEVRIEKHEDGTRASAALLQKNAPEELITAVPIYADLGNGDLRFVARVFADGSETQIRISVPAGTKKLVVDPHETILTNP